MRFFVSLICLLLVSVLGTQLTEHEIVAGGDILPICHFNREQEYKTCHTTLGPFQQQICKGIPLPRLSSAGTGEWNIAVARTEHNYCSDEEKFCGGIAIYDSGEICLSTPVLSEF